MVLKEKLGLFLSTYPKASSTELQTPPKSSTVNMGWLPRAALLAWLGGWGVTDPCPATTLGSQLPTHLQRAPSTHRTMHCLEQNRVQGNTCPYSSGSAKMRGYLGNYTAERAMSDTRHKTWHLLLYERRKQFLCHFRFSECWYHDHWENN